MLGGNLAVLYLFVLAGIASDARAQLQLVLEWDGISPSPVPIEQMLRHCGQILGQKELDKTTRLAVLLRKSDAEYFTKQDTASAGTAQEILNAQPDNWDALFRLGRAEGQISSKKSHALDIAEKLIRITPESAKGYYLAGCFHLDAQQFSKAISYFDKCIDKEMDFGRPYFLRAAANLGMNKFEAALKDVETAFGLPPTQHDDTGHYYFLRGAALHETGCFCRAAADLLQAKKHGVVDSKLHVMLWSSLAQQKKYGSALSHSETMIRLDPKNSDLHWLRARSLAQFGRLKESEEEAELALRSARDKAGAWLTVAIVKEIRGDYSAAVLAYHRAADAGGLHDALVRIVFFLSTCPEQKYRDGKVARKLTEEHFPSITPVAHRRTAQIVMSMALAECGEYKTAAETVAKAAKIGNPDPDLVKRCNKLRNLYEQRKPYRHDASRPQDHIFAIDPGMLIYVPIADQTKEKATPKN
jgi:tetratricopeptide (TPR) repeat protein